MFSNSADRFSFQSLFVIIVFLPIFFLPFTNIPIETAKGLLLVLGLCIAVIFWTIGRFTEGNIILPKSHTVLFGLVFLFFYLLSALNSSSKNFSLFGTLFDFGSFYFMFSAFVLMLMSSILVRSTKSAKIILFGFMLSVVFLFIFQTVHVFFPEASSLGFLTKKTDNVMGSWNALGVMASFFTMLCLYIIQFFSIPQLIKKVLGIFMMLSLFVLAFVNFYIAWAALGIFSLFIFIYKIYFSFHKDPNQKVVKFFPFLPFILFMISILFFVGTGNIGAYIPTKLGLNSTESSPSFLATFEVGKGVLKEHPFLGVGPNRFGEAWAMHKPSYINQGIFWNNYFENGWGVVPTIFATVGFLGILSFVLFFLAFLLSGIRAMVFCYINNKNWEAVCLFFATLFLFAVSFLYYTGVVVFLSSFAFLGMFIGVSSLNYKNKEINILFSDNPNTSFIFLFFLAFVMFASGYMGFSYLEKFSSVSIFRNVFLEKDNIDASMVSIQKAIDKNPNDFYLRSAAEINLVKFNELAVKKPPLPAEEQAVLQSTIDKSVEYAKAATEINPTNYLNFQLLGYVNQMLGQFGVKDRFPEAIKAYEKSSSLNPKNPGIKVALSRVAFLDGRIKEAEVYARESIALKEDYVDGWAALSQIQNGSGKKSEALNSAQKALSYVQADMSRFPDDSGLMSLNLDLKNYIKTLESPEPKVEAKFEVKKETE